MNPGSSGPPHHQMVTSVVSSSSSADVDGRHHGVIKDETDSDMYDDDDDDDEGMNISDDNITSQLASAGPTGMAAAAAISSTKKRKRSHAFETNPSIRKRQQTRLLRKLKQNIDEYSLRVGQQAVVLIATPGGKTGHVNFRAFGAKPLEDVVKNLRAVIMTELETALAEQAPPAPVGDPSMYELPPLVIEGIPTPVEKMTQAQLRAFIPLMLKYSTGRGKPGWGKECTKPPWWPRGVPWANVRMDARHHDEKQKVSWTHALRQIVTNCYEYHGRQDLLPTFSEDGQNPMKNSNVSVSNEASGIDVKPQLSRNHHQPASSSSAIANGGTTSVGAGSALPSQVPATIVQTISNPDGSVSIIQVDPSNPVITLSDGTTAHIAHIDGSHISGDLDGHPTSLGLSGEIHAPEGSQILIAGEDGQAYPVHGMITVPIGTNMYQAVLQGVDAGGGGQLQVIGSPIQLAPAQQHVKLEHGLECQQAKAGSSTLTITPVGSSTVHHHPVTTASSQQPVLQMVAAARSVATAAGKPNPMVTSTTGKQQQQQRLPPQSPTRQPDTTDSVD